MDRAGRKHGGLEGADGERRENDLSGAIDRGNQERHGGICAWLAAGLHLFGSAGIKRRDAEAQRYAEGEWENNDLLSEINMTPVRLHREQATRTRGRNLEMLCRGRNQVCACLRGSRNQDGVAILVRRRLETKLH
jgi:hypothetical protein